MNILDKIITQKRRDVEERKKLTPLERLRRSLYYKTPVVSLKEYIMRPGSSGVIAEIKRKSPSRGEINAYIDIKELSLGYMQAGASAISVLTDTPFFGGSLQDLETARAYNYCPVLCKDFIIDPYQLDEAKAHGADVILLIARALDTQTCLELAKHARSLGMEVLLEVHNKEEIKYYTEEIDLIGVNSRSLQDFSTDLNRTEFLFNHLPADCPRIAESGIHGVSDYARLRSVGYEGFLIGTHFMKNTDPAGACQQFIQSATKTPIQV